MIGAILLPRKIIWSEAARPEWAQAYHELSKPRPGLAGAIAQRGEAQVVRLALIYALLDKSYQIEPVHLRAARAVWDYSEASVRYIFGASLGDEVADTILEALRVAGAAGYDAKQHLRPIRSPSVPRPHQRCARAAV